MRWLAVVACAASACQQSKPPAAIVVTLDVAGFEPPFEEVPLSREFVRAHHVTVVIDRVGESTTRTVYGPNGLPTLVSSHVGAAGPWTDGPRTDYVLDADRVLRRTTTSGDDVVTDTYQYIDTRVARIVRTKPGSDRAQEEIRTYDGAGRLAKRTRGDAGQPPFETLTFEYDAAGRMSRWSGSKPGYTDDRYTFEYSTDGQLAKLAFVESGKPIYDRTFTYDKDGYLLRAQQHASVPAMGDETRTYDYDLADGAAIRSSSSR